MPLPRMRSIYQALDMIREEDPDTQVSYHMVRKLCLENKIRCFKSGSKIILNFDDLVEIMTTGKVSALENNKKSEDDVWEL